MENTQIEVDVEELIEESTIDVDVMGEIHVQW